MTDWKKKAKKIKLGGRAFTNGKYIDSSIEGVIDRYSPIDGEYIGSIASCSTKECEDGLDVNSLLDGPICHSGFNRLN